MKSLNEKIALWLSAIFASMWCFWAFNFLSFLPILFPLSLPYVQFISSGWLQLIALPLLAVSGVIIGRKADARAEQDHQAIMELVRDLHSKHDALAAQVNSPADFCAYNDD